MLSKFLPSSENTLKVAFLLANGLMHNKRNRNLITKCNDAQFKGIENVRDSINTKIRKMYGKLEIDLLEYLIFY
jgi:hypothetical protein